MITAPISGFAEFSWRFSETSPVQVPKDLVSQFEGGPVHFSAKGLSSVLVHFAPDVWGSWACSALSRCDAIYLKLTSSLFCCISVPFKKGPVFSDPF